MIISLLYQSEERTLKEQEINEIQERICQKLIRDLGAIRR
jgi:phenylalanyl-tRNA synthetase beta subunit